MIFDDSFFNHPFFQNPKTCVARKYLNVAADFIDRHLAGFAPMFLRILLAYEFAESGLEKLNGDNWFADLTFPFPFNILPAGLMWFLAIVLELLGPLALVLGLATRLTCVALGVLTVVAIAAVHWPSEWQTLGELWQGYTIIDKGHGNFKLPLMYLLMLGSLFFSGAGSLSLDGWLGKHYFQKAQED